MNMKKVLFPIFICLTLLVTSCHREVKQFTGDYSYKLSGEVAITDEDGDISYLLVHKTGQMNILPDKNSENANDVIITMNELNGGAYTIHATINDDAIVLSPYDFNTNILSTEGTSIFDQDNNNSIVYRISAAGQGYLNDEILVIDEQWSGVQSGNHAITLSSPKMTILAERN